MPPPDYATMFKEAWKTANTMYDEMTEQQRAVRERKVLQDPKYEKFRTNDGVSVLKKVLAEDLFNVQREQATMGQVGRDKDKTAGKARQSPVTEPQVVRKRPVIPSQQWPAVEAVPAVPEKVEPEPLFLQPSSSQTQYTRHAPPQELHARRQLAHGIHSDGATPTPICQHHDKQMRDLQAWSQAPLGRHSSAAAPCSPAVFAESVTSQTALLPMCTACAVDEAALTMIPGAAGRVVYQMEVVDTCRCGSRITGSSCWFCELGRIEAVKRLAIEQRTVAGWIEAPCGFSRGPKLQCACGKRVPIPEVARKCVGCGGVKTAPFCNFAGCELVFEDGSETVKAGLETSAGLSVGGVEQTCMFQPQEQGGLYTTRGKRTAAQAFSNPDLPTQNEPQRTASGTSRATRKADERNTALFLESSEVAKELKNGGLDVPSKTCRADEVTPLLRAEVLLQENRDYMFEKLGGLAIYALKLCGFDWDAAVVLFDAVTGSYGERASGAQILDMMRAIDWPKCLDAGSEAIVEQPLATQPAGQGTPVGHSSLDVPTSDAQQGFAFSQADLAALRDLNIHHVPPAERLASLPSAAQRAKALLEANTEEEVNLSSASFARLLRLCGFERKQAESMGEEYEHCGEGWEECWDYLRFFEGEFA
ncbi:hypothetical protein B0A50_01383 [Salinomyces thailandicus]|uniref:Uncharacterized protein n=1 Tax=Salinomyces thailandicus TaxID=706561 RepID=A0A4U0UCU1_9PEZI|nr:hypothetical protein B0A50_01383 [Salinomyces thailandica]